MPTAVVETDLNIDVPTAGIRAGIAAITKAVATRSSLPILTHMKIAVKDGKVSMMATDLEMWIEHILPSPTMSSDAEATVPAKSFNELIAAISADAITITRESDTNAIKIKTGRKSEYKLLGLEPGEFPLLPAVVSDPIRIDAGELKRLISQTIFATSNDETRIILTGMLFEIEGDTLRAVSTDTHRLCVGTVKLTREPGENMAAIVPSRVLATMLPALDKCTEPVDIQIAAGQIRFMIPRADGSQTTMISRLIDGQFPNWQRVIPASPARTITLRREELSAAVKRAAIVARENNNRLVFHLTDNAEKVSLTAESGSVGNAFEEIEIVCEGQDSPLEIAFNAKYLLEVLGVLDSEGVQLELTESLRPGVLKMSGNDTYLSVIMPMQVV